MTKTTHEAKNHSQHEGSRWIEKARALPPEPLNLGVPIVVYLGEAIDIAKFVRDNWAPVRDEKTGKVLRPGLASAEKKDPGPAAFTAKIADEIIELHDEAQRAQTRRLLATKADVDLTADMDRAAFLIGEMSATLEWAFDDGVEDDKDAQLAAVEGAHADDGDSQDERAATLIDYAALAHKHRKHIDGVLDFDLAYIDEAKQLAAKLRGASAAPEKSNTEADAELDLRNRLLRLLAVRVKRARKAAQLVFRNVPETARGVTSAYLRRTKAARRRKGAKEEPGAEK